MAFGMTAPMPGVIQPAASTGGGGVDLQKILDIIGSKGGQTLINAAGAGMQAYGAHKDAEASREQNANQFAASTVQRLMENDQQNQLARASSAAAASPLGENQMFAQRQAMANAILPGLRNFSATPGDPAVAKAMGSTSGGFRLPEGGFDPAMIERLFGDAATLESIKTRQGQVGQINPRGPVQDLGTMFGDAGSAATQDVLGANQSELQRQMDEETRQRDIIMRAIDEDIKGQNRGPAPDGYEYDKKTGELKKKGSGFWGKLGKAALVAAPIVAAPFTGGASLALIGAGSGAALGAMNGGGVKGALTGAALGGVTAGLGGGAAGAAKQGISAGLKTAAKNPALYSAILGGAR